MSNLLQQIKAQNFAASIPQLNKLIHYQAINGFWEKSKRKYFRASEASLQEEQERLDVVSKHMQAVSARLSELVEDLKGEKAGLGNFIKSKNSELSEIESLLASARQHSSELTEKNTKASTLEERINATVEQAEERKTDIDEINASLKKLEAQSKSSLQETKKNNEIREEEYKRLVDLFNKKLDFIDSKKDYFEERNQYLDDLIGREVGASLFETFKQRKKELVGSIGFWKWAVPVTAAASIGWIFFLFGNGDLSNLAWQVIVVNTLKALPAIGLLLFSISQYVKERNFQEEYAFKSAVALTINSYADQLQEKENKDKMIMDSVGQIYKSPIHQKVNVKDQNTIAASVKDLLETAKSIVPDK